MKDRGVIKWSSLMLPEHKKLLAQLYKEENYLEKPELTEEQYEEINRKLLDAIGKARYVSLKIYKNHSFQTVEGLINNYNNIKKELKILDSYNNTIYLDINRIIDITIVD